MQSTLGGLFVDQIEFLEKLTKVKKEMTVCKVGESILWNVKHPDEIQCKIDLDEIVYIYDASTICENFLEEAISKPKSKKDVVV
jgi:hypothetical protein